MTNFSSNSTPSDTQRLEVIQELHKLLATVFQAAGGSIGVEPVIRLMQFSGVCAPLATQPPTVAEILEEVKDAGIKLTPTLTIKINNSPFQKVRDAIAIYTKVYGKGGGKYPESVFCEILENEVRKSKP
ncbi:MULTISPECIES: hypothetical protein [Cyanophyceae]|uniref:hypothetical protein n=1 Tax=Cyanophyceae TaxID=3028117 RepID=UPI0016862F80|nr:hypothetical protein [Trichocoleus sp. FACHB-40]MBD2006185.1 hypothetical protein [Trichocoleus sp. FACHB-40]